MGTLQVLDFGDTPGHPFHGNQFTNELTGKDYEGLVGRKDHITRVESGTIDPRLLADVPGVKGEVPGEHRNRKGADWEAFVKDVRENGVQSPPLITVDRNDVPRLSEGNHRRDAAIEAGLTSIPIEVRYFGKAEEQGHLLDRVTPNEPGSSDELYKKFGPSGPLPLFGGAAEVEELGDRPGHDFRGNQYKSGVSGPAESVWERARGGSSDMTDLIDKLQHAKPSGQYGGNTEKNQSVLQSSLIRAMKSWREGTRNLVEVRSIAKQALEHDDPKVKAAAQALLDATHEFSTRQISTLEFGDTPGHDFHGNQWTGGQGEGDDSGPGKHLTGGLKPEDFPHGVYPKMIDEYHAYETEKNMFGELRSKGEPYKSSLAWTEEEQQKARDSLADVVSNNEPSSRIPMAAFKEILKTGVVQNQYETGRTGAATGRSREYEPRRTDAEERSFGVPQDAPGSARPVYGYMGPGDRADYLNPNNPDDRDKAIDYVLHSEKNAVLDDPDEFVLAITPSRYNGGEGDYVDVQDRQQLTDRAALNDEYAQKDMVATRYYPLGDGNGNLNDATVFAFTNKEFGTTSYGDVEIQYKRDVLDNATVTGGDSIDARLMGAPARMVEAADPRVPIGMVTNYPSNTGVDTMGRYTEIQMHEHPTIDDIASVRFTGSKPTAAVQSQLEERGITWTHEPAPKFPPKLSLAEVIDGREPLIDPTLPRDEWRKEFTKAREAARGVLVASGQTEIKVR